MRESIENLLDFDLSTALDVDVEGDTIVEGNIEVLGEGSEEVGDGVEGTVAEDN